MSSRRLIEVYCIKIDAKGASGCRVSRKYIALHRLVVLSPAYPPHCDLGQDANEDNERADPQTPGPGVGQRVLGHACSIYIIGPNLPPGSLGSVRSWRVYLCGVLDIWWG